MTNDYLKKKYSPFRLWKWYVVLYEWAISVEGLITLTFYAMEFDLDSFKNDTHRQRTTTILNHGVPFLLLVLDFFFNTVPFCWRHLILVNILTFTYLMINLAITKGTGTPIYQSLNWQEFISWTTLVIWPAIVSFFFICFKCFSDCKLVKSGFSACVMSMRDEGYIRKNTDLDLLQKEKDTFGVQNHY